MGDTRLRFQGKCFESTEGHEWMKLYDKFPPYIRHRLMESPFNICAACVEDEYSRTENFSDAIDRLELCILDELGPFGPQPVNPAPLVAKPRRRRQ